MANKFELPKSLESYRPAFEKTVKEVVYVRPSKGETGPFDSKFGGKPYFPKGEKYPLDEDGKPLRLLAQINWKDVPHIGDFPTSGILQFYVSADDDIVGCNFHDGTDQRNFQVRYFDEILHDESKLVSDFSFVQYDGSMFPLTSEASISFTKGSEIISAGEFRFPDILNLPAGVFGDTEEEEYCDLHEGFGHKIGGYPGFTQADPRERGNKDHLELLFQMDSDEEFGCMWGDCGIANFFIESEALKKKDFSNVLYNWDCS